MGYHALSYLGPARHLGLWAHVMPAYAPMDIYTVLNPGRGMKRNTETPSPSFFLLSTAWGGAADLAAARDAGTYAI